jgi:hypothetical protein
VVFAIEAGRRFPPFHRDAAFIELETHGALDRFLAFVYGRLDHRLDRSFVFIGIVGPGMFVLDDTKIEATAVDLQFDRRTILVGIARGDAKKLTGCRRVANMSTSETGSNGRKFRP